MACPPESGRQEFTLVRLSDVPLATRHRVAHRMIATEGLVGFAALELILAATMVEQDPELLLPSEKVAKVLRT
jgi:hypothetical protein